MSYLHTSRAAEIGRGKKDTKMNDLNELTPAPGFYDFKSDFYKKESSRIGNETVDGVEVQKIVPAIPWD